MFCIYKEKDLELTARIGKELLQQNNKLENTVASLEHELRVANEKITQFTHEVSKKTELIQILTNDMDDVCFETGQNGRPNLELLQRKMGKHISLNFATISLNFCIFSHLHFLVGFAFENILVSALYCITD